VNGGHRDRLVRILCSHKCFFTMSTSYGNETLLSSRTLSSLFRVLLWCVRPLNNMAHLSVKTKVPPGNLLQRCWSFTALNRGWGYLQYRSHGDGRYSEVCCQFVQPSRGSASKSPTHAEAQELIPRASNAFSDDSVEVGANSMEQDYVLGLLNLNYCLTSWSRSAMTIKLDTPFHPEWQSLVHEMYRCSKLGSIRDRISS
jgi:hypothetical protein